MKLKDFPIYLIIFAAIFCCTQLFAQEENTNSTYNPEQKVIHKVDINKLSPLQIIEDSLVFFADSMYNSQAPENRVDGSYAFIRTIKNMLKMQGSFSYKFPVLRESIVIVDAPDKSFRIYNWEVIRNTIEHRYYAVIQLSNGDFIPLVDVSDQIIRGADDSTFVSNRWYGCLYYNIIQKEVGGQNINFLFGWNANSMNSEKKLIDVFGFNSKGQNVFGAPLFNIIDNGVHKQVKRFIIEYQKGSKISLNYEKETDQIVFDHCESQIGDPAKKYTYIADGSYDGLKWDGQNWKEYDNIIQVQELQNGNAPVEKPLK